MGVVSTKWVWSNNYFATRAPSLLLPKLSPPPPQKTPPPPPLPICLNPNPVFDIKLKHTFNPALLYFMVLVGYHNMYLVS